LIVNLAAPGTGSVKLAGAPPIVAVKVEAAIVRAEVPV
jgi:hypothetical protein